MPKKSRDQELYDKWRYFIAEWHTSWDRDLGAKAWGCRCDGNTPDRDLCGPSKLAADTKLRQYLFLQSGS